MKLFHVSMMDRVESISERGIHPDFAQGKQKVSWWVEQNWIDWAIMHTSQRHRCPVDFLVIYEFDMNVDIGELSTMGFRRWQSGRWMYVHVAIELNHMSVSEYLLTYRKRNDV